MTGKEIDGNVKKVLAFLNEVPYNKFTKSF